MPAFGVLLLHFAKKTLQAWVLLQLSFGAPGFGARCKNGARQFLKGVDVKNACIHFCNRQQAFFSKACRNGRVEPCPEKEFFGAGQQIHFSLYTSYKSQKKKSYIAPHRA